MDPSRGNCLKAYTFNLALVVLGTISSFGEGQQHSEQSVIAVGPQDMVIAPGEMAYFNCFARGSTVYWYINSRPIFDESEYLSRGITFTFEDFPANTTGGLPWHNNTITVEGRLSNNNTRVSCTATEHRTGDHDYQEGILIIAGPPLPPSISYNVEHIENDTFRFSLFWNAFTWTGFPITSYTFLLINESSGQYINGNTTVTSQQYNFTTEGRYCALFTLLVSANNSLGRGGQSVVRIGNPIAAGEIGDIETIVTFYSNGTPHFWMNFMAPRICPGYQTLTYNITVYRMLDNSIIHRFGPTQYIQQSDSERALIVKELRTGLNVSEDYEVVVATESVGSLQSKRKIFDTNVTSMQCTTESASDHVSASEGGYQQRSIVIAVGTSSAVIIGTLVLIVTIQCCILAQQRRSLRFYRDKQTYSELDTLKTSIAQAEVCSTDGPRDKNMIIGP